MGEQKSIKGFLQKDPVFREKHEPDFEIRETAFSEESNNVNNLSGEMGWKYISLIDKSKNELIGRIYYDYPEPRTADPILRVRVSGLEENYKGKNLGIKLYEKLLEIAKEKNFEGIGSDATVAGGAIIIWKKLMEKGYKINIDPSVEEKWKLLLDTYNDGKIFKEKLDVDSKGSVFKILFREQGEKVI